MFGIFKSETQKKNEAFNNAVKKEVGQEMITILQQLYKASNTGLDYWQFGAITLAAMRDEAQQEQQIDDLVDDISDAIKKSKDTDGPVFF